MHEVLVPDIGDFKDVPIIEVLVKPGDTVKAEDSLITLESDKATMEVPAPAAGVVRDLRVKVGDKVSEGHPILSLEVTEGAAAPASAAPAPQQAPAPAPPPVPAAAAPAPAPASTPAGYGTPAAQPPAPPPAQVDEAGFSRAHASPGVRRFARELGVDLSKVRGSGPKERILKEDVQGFVKRALAAPAPVTGAAAGPGLGFALPAMPTIDFSKFGPVEAKPLSRIKKISGANLHRNWVAIPHVTQQDEVDITEMEAFRKQIGEEAQKQGVKLTPLAFMIKACVAALKQFPAFNASLSPDGESLVLKKYYHIGVAVDTPNGLVVPVIRDADQKGVVALARELGEVSGRMRDGKISPADMQGGTFSISSLGGIGGTHFTPIINAPEVAILGVSRSSTRPVWKDGAFVPRLMLPISLSYDHRVIDGAEGARFITFLNGVMNDIRRLIL
jgi:pyruvate dehydrogenase E2 component (dihydrolipoamide acetyltransferase)